MDWGSVFCPSPAERAFENDWFNREHDLNITKLDLMELLRIATKNDGVLTQEFFLVAMGLSNGKVAILNGVPGC